MAPGELIERFWEIIDPIVASEGMELVEVEFQSEPRGWVLRLYIDREGGVTLQDCTAVSREVGDLLDVKDLISHSYHLEVSSPGLDRPIRKPKDFDRFSGHRVKVSLSRALDGRRVFQGMLLGREGQVLRVDCGGKVFEIPLGEVAKARLIFPWGEGRGQGAARACN
jgi:ribosome maturation factor RimP